MKVRHLLVAILAGTALQQAATSQNGNDFSQVSMCVTTAIGTCGNFCQPFECQPNYTLVSSYERMIVDVSTAPMTSYVLFVGYAAPGCLQVPGIEGMLATWTLAAPIAMGSMIDAHYRPDLPCQPAATQHVVSFPLVPAGVDLRFQVLGTDRLAFGSDRLVFSRPVEVRTR
ncbi:MAG: hypothetical protein KDC98_16575 [Planctomycetes bacterium]|nr:hypothetical protein [Planctomycetota bacterium]